MSRSIHDTWGVMDRVKHADWSDPEIPEAIVARLWANIDRQWAVRTSERRLRRRDRPPLLPVDPDRLPIIVEDEAPYVFHAAGEQDIREILRRLPRGSLDGLQAIRLEIDRREETDPLPRDPFTGRGRLQLLPGVYTSLLLGWYRRSTATVGLHAYLGEPAAIAPFAAWLRLRALKTLLHELAHHFDLSFRTGRGRWDLADHEKKEAWAHRRGGVESDRIVTEYLLERYPEEVARLQSWFEAQLGVELPPIIPTIDDHQIGLVFPFRHLVLAAHAGDDIEEIRVTFARAAHREAVNDVAGRIVGAVLERNPEHPRGLALRACMSLCVSQDAAQCAADCRRAIASDPGCLDALETVVRCHAKEESWPETAAACERALAVLPVESVELASYLLTTLVESHLLLGDSAAVDSALAQVRAWGADDLRINIDLYRVLDACWREDWEGAYGLSSRLLAKFVFGPPGGRWLVAARFESAQHLGKKLEPFDRSDLEQLESSPFTRRWAQRIRDLIVPEPPSPPPP